MGYYIQLYSNIFNFRCTPYCDMEFLADGKAADERKVDNISSRNQFGTRKIIFI